MSLPGQWAGSPGQLSGLEGPGQARAGEHHLGRPGEERPGDSHHVLVVHGGEEEHVGTTPEVGSESPGTGRIVCTVQEKGRIPVDPLEPAGPAGP